MNRDGLITIGDEEKHGENELDSTSEISESTTDEVKIEDEEVNLCGIPVLHTCGNPGARGGVTFILEKASLTLAYVGKVRAVSRLILFHCFWINLFDV